jgi:hypothetical protein
MSGEKKMFNAYATSSSYASNQQSASSSVYSNNPLYQTQYSTTGNIEIDRCLLQIATLIQDLKQTIDFNQTQTLSYLMNNHPDMSTNRSIQISNRSANASVDVQIKEEYLQYITRYGIPSDGIFIPELLYEKK